jgi:hypothetical protein
VQLAGGLQLTGRHIRLDVAAGASVNLYANLDHTLLLFARLPGLNLRSHAWLVLNWGRCDLGPDCDPITRKKLGRNKLELAKNVHMLPEARLGPVLRTQLARRAVDALTCGVCTRHHGEGHAVGPWESRAAREAEESQNLPAAMSSESAGDAAAPRERMGLESRRESGRTYLCRTVVDGTVKRVPIDAVSEGSLSSGQRTPDAEPRSVAASAQPDSRGASASGAGDGAGPSGGGSRAGHLGPLPWRQPEADVALRDAAPARHVTQHAEHRPGASSVGAHAERASGCLAAEAGRAATGAASGDAPERDLSPQDRRLLQSVFDMWRCARNHEGARLSAELSSLLSTFTALLSHFSLHLVGAPALTCRVGQVG